MKQTSDTPKQTPGYLRRRVLVTLRDPDRAVVEAKTFDVNLSGDPDNPGDHEAQDRIAEYVGRFIGAMGGEGMACSVTCEQVCTFPGCGGPTRMFSTLCDPCAEATL